MKFFLCLLSLFCLFQVGSAITKVETNMSFNFANLVPKVYNCPAGAPRLPNDTLVEVKLGGLTDVLGSSVNAGPRVVLAWKIAVRELNVFLKAVNSPYFVTLVLEDTESNPDKALAKIQKLYNAGVRIFLGPSSSSEVAAVADFVARNNIVLISPTSTSVALSKPDNIFRLAPTDDVSAAAFSKLILSEKITKIFSVHRTDSFGSSFASSFQSVLPSNVSLVDYPYDTTTSFDNLVDALNRDVSAAINSSSASSVGVLLVSFDEWITILTAANRYPALRQITWFGPELSALSNVPAAVSALASATPLLTLRPRLPDTDLKDSLRAAFLSVLVSDIPQDAYYAYDSAILAFFSFVLPRSAANPKFKQSLQLIADQLHLTTQRVAFNANGDRALDLDFDALAFVDNKWKTVAYSEQGVWTWLNL
eukprot:TRINITY_DN2637_c0_g1_i1.p1 TRINITY_DN2637_c0_g1~~TRINITY_DN2637_c0_g1_i1.p1  ORF type:complete len:422 (-),score=160.53 TRINITY_DN2637_c0_g1_i1:218-1483(-)